MGRTSVWVGSEANSKNKAQLQSNDDFNKRAMLKSLIINLDLGSTSRGRCHAIHSIIVAQGTKIW
jgi:hypothetical protein